MTESQQRWQLAGNAAELYERYLVPAVTAHWAQDLVERVHVHEGDRVCDAACGTGVVARASALLAGASGRVVGIDLNDAMLAVARASGASVEWLRADLLDLPFGPDVFDVALCQFGLQFVPDRPLALAELRRVLCPGGRLGCSVFGPIEHNPATHALSDALDRRLGIGASLTKRNEHSLADVESLRSLVANAGFVEVRVETVTKSIRFPSVADYVRIQLAATPLASLGAADSETLLVQDVTDRLAPYTTDAGLTFPQEAHIVLASAA